MVPRRRAARAPHPRVHPLERDGDGRPVELPVRGAGRAPFHVRVGGRSLRRRVQPLLPRQARRWIRRPGLSTRATRRRASTPGRSSRAASARSSSTGSAARSTAAGCRAIRTRGACPSSGSSRPCRWASARSTPSPRRASTATCMHREIADTSAARVWAFVGDGEMDEPEAMAGLSIAAREQLDNLIFVVNCNLQRLDGPVRGNGKIIQELEAIFRGAGWNVIKVDLGPRVGRAARPRCRRRARQQDEQHRRRRVPEVRRSRAATTSESTSSGPTRGSPAGRAPVRRRAAHAAARWSRLPQGLRGVQDGGRARGQPHRDPRQDDQGVDARHHRSSRATRRTRSRSSPPASSRCSATVSSCRSPTPSSKTATRPTGTPGSTRPSTST